MLIDNSSFPHSFSSALCGFFRNSMQKGGECTIQAFQSAHYFANHLVNSHAVASSISVISHVIFVSIADLFAKTMNNEADNSFSDEDENKKVFHSFFLDGVLFGTSFAFLSYIFSRRAQHPLQPAVLTAVVITVIAARIILKINANLQKEIQLLKNNQESLDCEAPNRQKKNQVKEK